MQITRGTGQLDGANPTPIDTGLTACHSFVCTLNGTGAPGVGTSVLTAQLAGGGGMVNVFAWKPTSNSDPTLVASTGTESFTWLAVGV